MGRLVSVFMSMNALPKTLVDAIRYFTSADNCREYLVTRRWPNGVACPQCGSTAVYFDKGRNGWECKTRHPKRKFTLKTGTIFEDSPLGLDKWLPAVWMIANCKNGVSSHELARSIGVTQKTAWFMLQRIRLAMQDENGGGKLGGEVEVDETYIGGKARNMHARKRKALMTVIRQDGQPSKTNRWAGKVPVLGILERGAGGTSRVRTKPVADVRAHRLQADVRANVEAGSQVFTDALHSYHGLRADFVHEVVDHAECYAKGNVHTNGLESYWSLLKRALGGTYVSVEPFHLFRYLDEQAFRFNERLCSDAERFVLVLDGIVGRRLTYEALTGALDAGTV
jgi:transposase-like protein